MGGWTRNYYNWLTACYGEGNRSVQSTAVPTAYSEPLMMQSYTGGWFSLYNRADNNTAVYSIHNAMYLPLMQRKMAWNTTIPQSGENLHGWVYYDENAVAGSDTYNDYTWSGVNKSGYFTLSAQNKVTTYDAETHSYTLSYKITLTNNTTSPQTINEVLMGVGMPNSATGVNSVLAVVYKEYIEPVTLEASESVVIELKSIIPIFNYTPYPTA